MDRPTLHGARFDTADSICSFVALTGAAARTPSTASKVISIVFLRRALRDTLYGITELPYRISPISVIVMSDVQARIECRVIPVKQHIELADAERRQVLLLPVEEVEPIGLGRE